MTVAGRLGFLCGEATTGGAFAMGICGEGRIEGGSVGKANRVRRRAKEKERKQRHQGPAGGARRTGGADAGRGQPAGHGGHAAWFRAERQPSGPELAERLMSDAMLALSDKDDDAFGMCAAELCAAQLTGRSDVTGWRRTVDQALFTCMLRSVTAAWHRGWQPAELARHAGREFGARQARMMADAIAAEMRQYAAATVDESWEAQLTGLGARVWWERDDGYLDQWRDREGTDNAAMVTCALEVLFVLATLPALTRLCPLPGEARRGSLGPRQRDGQEVSERMLGKVRALLAKAESTEFPDEAEALTARAQELMARHSIDYALLAAGSGSKDEPAARRLAVDNPYEAPKAVLLDVVAQANRCRAVWTRHLGLSTVLGFPCDLDGVELLFTSLLVQATTAMLHHGARRDAYGRSRTRSFRQSFLTSYAQRIGERLTEAVGCAQRQAAAQAPGTDLLPVLAARDHAVDQAVDTMFPELIQRAVTSASDREGWISGRAAADLATLHGRTAVPSD